MSRPVYLPLLLSGLLLPLTTTAHVVLNTTFETETAGAKPASVTAVRPSTNTGTTDALPITPSASGPIGAVVIPFSGSPAMPVAGSGRGVRFYDYHSGSGGALEWDFVPSIAEPVAAVKASVRFAATREIAGGGAVRLSIGRPTASNAPSLNAAANRPFLVTLYNDGRLRLELSGKTPQQVTFDTASAHILTVYANDHETKTVPATAPDGSALDLAPNTVVVYLNTTQVGSGTFDTASGFNTSAGLGRFGMTTLTSEVNIDFVFDDVVVDVLEGGDGIAVPPGPVNGFGSGTGDPTVPNPVATLVRSSAGLSVTEASYHAYIIGMGNIVMLRSGTHYWVGAEGSQWVVPPGYPVYNMENSRVIGSYHGRLQSLGEMVTLNPSTGRLAILLQNNRTDVTLKYRVPIYTVTLSGGEDATGAPLDWAEPLSGAAAADLRFMASGGSVMRATGFDRAGRGERGNYELEVDIPPRGVRKIDLTFGALVVDSPMAWQVFQRTSRTAGPMRVEGRAPAGTTSVTVEVTAASSSAGGGLHAPAWAEPWPTGELPVPVDAAGRFSSTLRMPAGGWYALVVRARDASGTLLASRTIEPWGVGEVFAGAGQSNSTNSGYERQKANSPLVVAFSGGHWQPGVDPMPGNHDTSNKGSYYPILGDLLAARFGVPIAFASTGHGGTTSLQWQKDAPHTFTDFDVSIRQGQYSWTAFRLAQLGVNGFRGLLWHQGESDSTHNPGVVRTSEQLYYDRMRALIENQRADGGWNQPWYMAKGTMWPLDTTGDPQIRGAVDRLVADGIAFLGADTDTLGLEYREPAVDATSSRVHFNAAGLAAHAGLWAEILGEDLDKAFHGAGARDTDGGGVPDYWEKQHGLDPANPDDDASDPDGNGLTYREEFLLGREPGERRPLQVEAVDADNFMLRWEALPGRGYTVEALSSPTGAGNWTTVGPVRRVDEPGWLEATPDPSGPLGLYRIRITRD